MPLTLGVSFTCQTRERQRRRTANAASHTGERWISVSDPPPLPSMRTVSPAPAGPETPNNGTAFRFKLLFADHAAELWPQISFDVRKSLALFIDHFSLSNMRPLIDRRFQCSACGLMFVSLWLFVSVTRPALGLQTRCWW